MMMVLQAYNAVVRIDLHGIDDSDVCVCVCVCFHVCDVWCVHGVTGVCGNTF